MANGPFGKRYGFAQHESEISVVDDAPYEIRTAILKIAEGDLELAPSFLRDLLCTVLRKVPDRNNWSEYPNVWEECQRLIEDAPWYRVYDFVELLYRHLAKSLQPDRARSWANLINEYFVEAGVGWRLVDGQLERRGAEGFEESIDRARSALEDAGLPTARQEMHEALRDLARRPEPDLTGAVQHGMAALECAAREVSGDRRGTLGEIIRHHGHLIPKPLDEALTKMWGYASEVGRHIREGRTPAREEAELVVRVAAATAVYLCSIPRRPD